MSELICSVCRKEVREDERSVNGKTMHEFCYNSLDWKKRVEYDQDGWMYYKCIKSVKGETIEELLSCNAYGMAKVEYKIGEYVSSPDWLKKTGLGLFVFDSIISAKIFIRQTTQNYIQIWECCVKGKISIPLQSMYKSLYFLSIGNFQSTYFENFPDGTRMVEEVKLLRRVM